MSDIYVHLKAADAIYKACPANIRETITNHRQAYNLGAQGPDVLFYHRIFPWTATSALKKFGHKVHTKNINAFFTRGFDHIEALDNQDLKALLSSYFYGFLTHYAIDTQTHPYIFYYSGHKGGYNHKYYECLLDSVMAKRTSMAYGPTHKKIKLSSKDGLAIAHFLHTTIEEVYRAPADLEDIEESIKDMVTVLAVMYDPLHLKKPLIGLIDKVSHSRGKLITGIFPRKLDPDVDYFNLNHKEWYHPCPPHRPSRASFLDLLDTGQALALKFITAGASYMEKTMDKDEFQTILGNLAYDTGLRSDEDHAMTLSDTMVQYT